VELHRSQRLKGATALFTRPRVRHRVRVRVRVRASVSVRALFPKRPRVRRRVLSPHVELTRHLPHELGLGLSLGLGLGINRVRGTFPMIFPASNHLSQKSMSTGHKGSSVSSL